MLFQTEFSSTSQMLKKYCLCNFVRFEHACLAVAVVFTCIFEKMFLHAIFESFLCMVITASKPTGLH